MLGYLLNGWNGTFLYYVPRGYDARYWNTIIDANRSIAAYEDFVFKGKEDSNYSVDPVTALPEKNLPAFWSEGGDFAKKIPTLKDAAIIQSRSYKLGKERLIAIGNFWQKGEVFAEVKIKKLTSSQKYVIAQPVENKIFSKSEKKNYFTGKELAKGVTLHAGALRWAIYVVKPYKKSAKYETVITQDEVAQEMDERTPVITQAIEWEKNYSKKLKNAAAKADGIPDYSAMKDMDNKGLSCKVVDFEKAPALQFSASDQKITLAPAIGGQIKVWKKGDSEYIGTGSNAMIAADGFWWPKDAVGCLFTPYEFVSQEKTDTGVRVNLKRTFSHKDSKSLVGNMLEKSYDINSDGSVKITTTVTNTTGQPINFSYRRKSMINFMGVDNGQKGKAELGDFVYQRDFTQKLLRYSPNAEKDLEKVFSMERILKVNSPEAVFSAPFLTGNLKYNTVDNNKLHCYVFWDSGKQKFATFEPIFEKVSLGLKESWSITTTWKVE
jgi:hypothetical protein